MAYGAPGAGSFWRSSSGSTENASSAPPRVSVTSTRPNRSVTALVAHRPARRPCSMSAPGTSSWNTALRSRSSTTALLPVERTWSALIRSPVIIRWTRSSLTTATARSSLTATRVRPSKVVALTGLPRNSVAGSSLPSVVRRATLLPPAARKPPWSSVRDSAVTAMVFVSARVSPRWYSWTVLLAATASVLVVGSNAMAVTWASTAVTVPAGLVVAGGEIAATAATGLSVTISSSSGLPELQPAPTAAQTTSSTATLRRNIYLRHVPGSRRAAFMPRRRDICSASPKDGQDANPRYGVSNRGVRLRGVTNRCGGRGRRVTALAGRVDHVGFGRDRSASLWRIVCERVDP